MKRNLPLLLLLLINFACSTKQPTHRELVTQYYAAFNQSDYDQIESLISDSIVIVEGDYIMPYSKISYYEQFRWDSVFQPTYKIINLEQQDEQIIATIAVESLRYKFLKNNPLTCRHQISFEANMLSKFEVLDCLEADWQTWEKERDSLVAWTSLHHPELDGFVHDLTMEGAIKYLKAIEYYQNQ